MITVSIPGGSITDLVSTYLSAQTRNPVVIQELVLVVPSVTLTLIANMPVVTRLDVVARDTAVHVLTSDLRDAVDLVSGQAPTQGTSGRPAPGALGGVTAPKPHVISLYTHLARLAEAVRPGDGGASRVPVSHAGIHGRPLRLCLHPARKRHPQPAPCPVD